MGSIPGWQVAFLCGIVSWIAITSMLNVTRKLRSLTRSWVSGRVVSGTPLILQIQKYHNGWLDAFFSGLSCVVSVPFYTAFLPLLFWSGHGKLARQMTLLMAFCDYLGNCIKDVVSAPRPRCPPVRRVTATKDEKENAMEYGLPSSHTLNTVCLSGYLLHYVISYTHNEDASMQFAGFAMVFLFVGLIGLGRIYLGMHSLVDIICGLAFGLAILAFWISVHEYIDNFIVSGKNVTSFWAALSFLLLFAYPTPELPTPSFEYHTAFIGVALGIVKGAWDAILGLELSWAQGISTLMVGIRLLSNQRAMKLSDQVTGIQQTYYQFHHDAPRIFTPQLTIPAFVGRMLVGIPTILLVKFCSKALAKWSLPIVANTLGIPIKSTGYVPSLCASNASKKSDEPRQSGYLQKLLFFSSQDSFDVDTGIRLLQYAGLAWSVVDLVPSLFSHLNL